MAVKKRRSTKWVEIFIDGSFSQKTNVGGWGAVLRYGPHHSYLKGFSIIKPTAPRMELLALYKALSALNRPCLVSVYSDSQYVVDCAMGTKTIKANLDLWKPTLKLIKAQKEVRFNWIKGHADYPLHNEADKLATQGRVEGERFNDR